MPYGVSTSMGAAFQGSPTPSVVRFGLNLVNNQPASVTTTTAGARTILMAGPYPNGTGAGSKFFSGGTGGFVDSYNDFVSSGAGAATNEANYHPIFCAKKINATDTANVGSSMHLNFPTLSYSLIADQEADAILAPGTLTWPTGSDYTGVITKAALAGAYKDIGTHRASFADPSKCTLGLSLTSNKQVNSISAGFQVADFHNAFVTAGATVDYVFGDIYKPSFTTVQGKPTKWTAAFFMQWLADAATLFGCRWGAIECGVTLANASVGDTDTDAKNAAQLQQVFDFCAGDPRCDFFFYWHDFWLNGYYHNTCQGNGSEACSPNMADGDIPLSLAKLTGVIG